LLGQQNEAIPQAQNRKGRTVPQAKILPELFGNRGGLAAEKTTLWFAKIRWLERR
jgi:hypothetical protein